MLDPKAKANLLADNFVEKCVLPTKNWQSHIGPAASQLSDFILMRKRWTLAALRGIYVDKATGPDLVPGKILRECASELASPLTRLIRRLVRERCWPDLWRFHWIAPLYKKEVPLSPMNYCGMHLTTITSKVAERVIARVLVK